MAIAEPMKSRSTKDLTEACKRIYARWKATRVICPNWHVLDNKAPADFLQVIGQTVIKLRRHWQTCTGKTLPSAQSKHTRTISLQPWLAYQMTSRSTNGTSWSHKLYLLWISYNNHMWRPMSWHMHTITEISITTECHLLPWAVLCNSTSNQTDASLGVSIQVTAGTSQHLQITTYTTLFLLKPPEQNKSPTSFISSTSTQPTLMTEDLMIKAIQDLSYAIKGGKNLVATHKSKQSLDSPMCSDLETNCHSMPGCSLMHLEGCSLTHPPGCSLASEAMKNHHLMQDHHQNWLLSIQLHPLNQ